MVARIFFYIYNIGLYGDVGFFEFIKILFIGIRFDLSVICYFNIVFILLHIIPVGKFSLNTGYQKFLKIYFVVVNSVLLFVNLADTVYFHFVQKRSTADIYKFLVLSDDVPTLIPGFIRDYWFVVVVGLVIAILIWFIYPSAKKYNNSNVNENKKVRWIFAFVSRIVLMLVFGGIWIIGARGGLQLKPLSIIDASKYVKASEMPLVLNSVFSIMTTYGKAELPNKHYFDEEVALENYPVVHSYYNADAKVDKKNVVVLLLESFSKEYVGALNNYNGYTPFLDSLMQHSLVMNNAFSNGLRSIDAIPAIVVGVPALMDDPFITSVYNTNKANSLAVMLSQMGYQTAFFHGGTNGTMNFDGFSGYAGFDKYYGRYEYGDDKDYDGYWGIFDEPFLQYFAQQMNTFKQPFFAFEFTLSSHYPYGLPENHKGQFPEGAMKIHKVIRYADYSLRKFFETAQTMPWYNNTMFVISADHPAQSVIPSEFDDVVDKSEQLSSNLLSYYKNTSGRYAIPIVIFTPDGSVKPGVVNETVQQTDLFPSILDYLNYDKEFVAFGTSVFDTLEPRCAFQYVSGLYQITSGKYSLLFDGDNVVSLYDNTIDPAHNNNIIDKSNHVADSLEITMKATLQQFISRMNENKLSVVD